jgi:hypothetical protein
MIKIVAPGNKNTTQAVEPKCAHLERGHCYTVPFTARNGKIGFKVHRKREARLALSFDLLEVSR